MPKNRQPEQSGFLTKAVDSEGLERKSNGIVRAAAKGTGLLMAGADRKARMGLLMKEFELTIRWDHIFGGITEDVDGPTAREMRRCKLRRELASLCGEYTTKQWPAETARNLC